MRTQGQTSLRGSDRRLTGDPLKFENESRQDFRRSLMIDWLILDPVQQVRFFAIEFFLCDVAFVEQAAEAIECVENVIRVGRLRLRRIR